MSSLDRPTPLTQKEEPVAPLRIKIIEQCDFPMVEKDIEGYKVLEIPAFLQHAFDEEGYDAVRINSVELANKFPVYGGKTTAGNSLLPHQDHSPRDLKRFLALSKNSSENRGSSTYLVRPEIVRKFLPSLISYFDAHRGELRQSFSYVPGSQVSQEEILSCFEPGGLDRLVEMKAGKDAPADIALFAKCGLIGYLIQGTNADTVVQNFLREHGKDTMSENWTTNGTFIIDNSKVFHGRLGSNEHPLKRNWFTSASSSPRNL